MSSIPLGGYGFTPHMRVNAPQNDPNVRRVPFRFQCARCDHRSRVGGDCAVCGGQMVREAERQPEPKPAPAAEWVCSACGGKERKPGSLPAECARCHHQMHARSVIRHGDTEQLVRDVEQAVDRVQEAFRRRTREFKLIRREDVSGVSGTGVVAIGVELPTGRCVMEWCGEVRSVSHFATAEEIEQIHGHEGRTQLVWVDAEVDRG